MKIKKFLSYAAISTIAMTSVTTPVLGASQETIEDGLYLGGDVDMFYTYSELIDIAEKDVEEGTRKLVELLYNVDYSDIVFVLEGEATSVSNLFEKESFSTALDTLEAGTLETSYRRYSDINGPIFNPNRVFDPRITSISFADAFDETTNTFTVDWGKLTGSIATPLITVSEDSQLTFTVDGVGSLRSFGLTAGENYLDTIDFSNLRVADLDLSGISFTNIYNTIDMEVLAEAVDFTGILNEITNSGTTSLKSDLYNAVDFSDIIDVYNNTDENTKLAVYKAINLSKMMDIIEVDNNIGLLKFNNVIEAVLDVLATKEGITVPTVEQIINGESNLSIAEILELLNEDDMLKIYNKVDFSEVFATLDEAETHSKIAFIDAVDFSTLINTAQGMNEESRQAIIDAINVKAVFAALDASDIDKNKVIEAIDLESILEELKKEKGAGYTLLHMLAELDGDPDDSVLTINLQLTDDDKNVTNYTLESAIK